MARIGLQGVRYATISSEGTASTAATYGTPATVGKAVGAKLAYELNSAELYADNALAESDYTFNKGTITITVADDDDATLAALLGRSIGTDPAEVVRKNTDTAPYVGVSRIITKLVGGTYKYKAEFLSKVKFKEPAPEEKTKGESVEFGTTDLEGGIAVLPNAEWSKSATFATLAEAESYLDDCFGVV